VQSLVRASRKERKAISVTGGRHAMARRCGTDTPLIKIRKMSRVLNLDRKHGILLIEAGIEWPELIDGRFLISDSAVSFNWRSPAQYYRFGPRRERNTRLHGG
jgi:FAD binding domain